MKIIACLNLALIIIALTALVSYHYFRNFTHDVSNHTHRDVITEATTKLVTSSPSHVRAVTQTAVANKNTSFTPSSGSDDELGQENSKPDDLIDEIILYGVPAFKDLNSYSKKNSGEV